MSHSGMPSVAANLTPDKDDGPASQETHDASQETRPSVTQEEYEQAGRNIAAIDQRQAELEREMDALAGESQDETDSSPAVTPTPARDDVSPQYSSSSDPEPEERRPLSPEEEAQRDRSVAWNTLYRGRPAGYSNADLESFFSRCLPEDQAALLQQYGAYVSVKAVCDIINRSPAKEKEAVVPPWGWEYFQSWFRMVPTLVAKVDQAIAALPEGTSADTLATAVSTEITISQSPDVEPITPASPAGTPTAAKATLPAALESVLTNLPAKSQDAVRDGLAAEQEKIDAFLKAYRNPSLSPEESHRRLSAINERRFGERLGAGLDSTDLADKPTTDGAQSVGSAAAGAAGDMAIDLAGIIREDPEAAGSLLGHTVNGLETWAEKNLSEAAGLLNRLHSPPEPVVTGGPVPGYGIDPKAAVERQAAETSRMLASEQADMGAAVQAQQQGVEDESEASARRILSEQGTNQIVGDPDEEGQQP